MRNKDPNHKWSLALAIVNIIMVAAFSILFNFFPEKVGYYPSATNLDHFVPILSADFDRYLPWLNFWWGLSFTVSVIYVSLRRRSAGLRWAEVGVDVVGLAVVLRMIVFGDMLRNTTADALLRLAFGGVVLGLCLSIVRRLFDLLKGWILPQPRVGV